MIENILIPRVNSEPPNNDADSGAKDADDRDCGRPKKGIGGDASHGFSQFYQRVRVA